MKMKKLKQKLIYYIFMIVGSIAVMSSEMSIIGMYDIPKPTKLLN